jgi:hypothetical protein
MNYRNQDHDVSLHSLMFRELWVESFGTFSIHTLEKSLGKKEEFLKVVEDLKEIETGEEDQNYFTCLYYLINALMLSLQGYKNKYSGLDHGSLIEAGRLNAEQFMKLSDSLDQSRPSIQHLRSAVSKLKNANSIEEIAEVISELNKIALPVILTVETHRYAGLRKKRGEEEVAESEEQEPETIVVSVLFSIDTELWANPQIVKPNQLYRLSGLVKLNKWPEGYEELILSPVSTSDNSWFVLSLPPIKATDRKEISIDGSIVLKFPQSLLDAPLSIKLLGRFTGNNKKNLYPEIIGYDQLILRVVDPASFEYPTGYNKLNEKVLEIFIKVKTKLPDVPQWELNNFLVLLSSILNYQGYCFQHAVYKKQNDLSEDNFRDKLIEYLSVNPVFSSSITKEGHLAGGRVEINYKGIIAELKVEKLISDRKKIIETFQNQPVVYASAASSQLSILCVLDLTEKIFPSSIAAKNVFLVAPTLHGHESEGSTSRVAVIFIDGNTKNPSAY